MSRSDQIAALKRLWEICHVTLKYCPPSNEGPDLSREERMKLYQESFGVYSSVENARHELLESGYPAPDHWLTVQVRGDLSRTIDADVDVVRMGSVDREALRKVCDELKAAFIRLEAGAEIGKSACEEKGSNDTENNIIEALRQHGRPLRGEPLGVKANGKFNSNIKSALASMVKRTIPPTGTAAFSTFNYRWGNVFG